MVIGGYFVNGCWWLLMFLYQWLLVAILLVDIGGYFIDGHLMVISGYCIISYCWLLYVIL
jgi:hypothetical protein